MPNPSTLLLLAIIALAIVMAAPVISSGWPPFLGIVLPFVVACLPFIWIKNVRVRIWWYRQWFKVAGPSAEVAVRGHLSLSPESDTSEVLEQVREGTRSWKKKSKKRVQVVTDNEINVIAGARTLTATVISYESEEDTFDEVDTDLVLSIELRGYESKVTTIDSLLDKEIEPLLLALARRCSSHNEWSSLSLNLAMTGRNPFLGFYLSDVPLQNLESFRIRLSEESYGHNVGVEVRANSLSIHTKEPRALVRSARRYLASPALAHLD